MDSARKRFAWFAWAVLAFNIPVILWGAYVRVSYSGDGCGANWPFCNGKALPQNMTKPTIIEFTHRMMTSLDTVLMLGLVGLAFWLFPKRHAVRRYAVASLVFLFVEAILGAGLVLFRLVARDQSVGRVWYLSAHLTNTMLLLGCMTITAWLWSKATASESVSGLSIRHVKPALLWAALVTVIVSVTGAVTALGDTLFPSGSLMEGVRRDLLSESPMLLRVRVAHPAIALAGAVFVIWTALDFIRNSQSGSGKTAGLRLAGLCCFQLLVGAANLTLLAPVWMQLFHLLIADIVWIAMVLLLIESATGESNYHRLELISSLSSESAAREPA